MADTSYPLPDYLRSAKPNPAGNRAAWFKNTAPSYAGIFLWIAFYDQMAGSTLGVGGIGAALIGLVVAGLISFVFYLAFGMWGMKTGQPLYIVGTSTFGEKGGYLAPGLLMGALQVGWYSVGTFFATQYILNTVYGVGAAPVPGDVVFIITGVVWGYVFALLGVLGIQYVAKVSQFFPAIPLLMLIYAAIVGLGGLGDFNYAELGQKTAEMNGVEYVSGMGVGIIAMISVVIGFFATAAAAGADFGMNARDKNDVVMGGLVGITLFIFISGALPMIAIAGIMGSHPELAGQDGAWTFTQAIGTLAGGRFIYLIFAIASMAPACFCSFIIANSFSTMIPSISRMAWTMGGATIGIILAVTGKAGNLIPFFRGCRRSVWTDLRRGCGGLSDFRRRVARTAQGHQPGWLHRHHSRLYRGY